MRDKHGVEIKPGDLVKVYHFTGARRKKHYMYKWILEPDIPGHIKGSHLSLNPRDTDFHVEDLDIDHPHWEIIQDGGKEKSE